MGLFEGIKDVASIVQKADNIELYGKLLDLESQALDMQSEIAELRRENEKLKKQLDEREDVCYHITKRVDELHREYPYITLKSDSKNIRYCAVCWGKDRKLIPLYDELNCIVCRQRNR